MQISRRGVLAASAGLAALAMWPIALRAQEAAAQTADELIAEFTGGADVADGDGVKLTAPEIAENGNTVPISVEAPGAAEILLVATQNPTPGVARFSFGPLAGKQAAATRIRLAKTQDVVAIAKMADGSFVRTASNVKVTIGGCGG
ncbi:MULTISPECIES: thiosulfate oxidation carrier protein SoxY [unclassified Paracoccus (in: a-proteobacteria)]|uniref:thiosulfate oxidation carrier protein SoxY n=1 Tax=unclassified Paracoccus (in: a-proteobacteria) TaxID=2688777 RepID=UPI0012B3B645|nr:MULTISPECIES: thiosulfate oxidation carrier protein SoxY [unclassified Paracoccus (in: a-proteobacteria)]UXU76337.1 thiosulfate oxidation carrier protein SoxY [Paracoccus sp. SMMA_5]UXU82325.1 thiosulfate oxidation carrier protein SoxY [Paracoccus sp. SMMA_5_TC]